MAGKDGYALEHRVVMFDAGLEIPKGAHVHHRNEDKADNRLENLEVMFARDHVLHHAEGFITNQYGTFPVKQIAGRAAG